jgi:putative ABC transport system permease protein
MFKDHLKVAIRNLWRNKKFSAINVLGLAIGLATCLLIFSFVFNEINYDKFNLNYSSIYRIDANLKFGGEEMHLSKTPDPMGAAMKKDYPDVIEYTRLIPSDAINFIRQHEVIRESKVAFADMSIFRVFTLPMLAGDPANALAMPNSIVLTESSAKKYFNSAEDAIGRTLVTDSSAIYKITGVIKDIPPQSHFNFDFFISMASNQASIQNNWLHHDFTTYILLRKGADPKVLDAEFPSFVARHTGPQLQQAMNTSLTDLESKGNYIKYGLTPLGNIHLHSGKTGELSPNGSIEYVYIASTIAAFILLIACINFMNLATARYSSRAREVGVRKVIGSSRINLVMQFISESTLISVFAMAVAIVIAILMLPYFNQLAGKQMSLQLFSNLWTIPGMLALALAVGVISGSYPAVVLSSFKPAQVLKSKLSLGFKSGWIRSTLVIFQFCISITLIVATLVINGQLAFIKNKDLGFDRNHVLIIKNTDQLGHHADVFKTELSGLPGVKAITMSGFLPTNNDRRKNVFFKSPALNPYEAYQMEDWPVDINYINTLEMEVIAGRNFSSRFATDSTAVILNETAVRILGLHDPIGKQLYTKSSMETFDKTIKANTVIGVIKDFNFNSLHTFVTPVVLRLGDDNENMAIRIGTSDIPGLLSKIKTKWQLASPKEALVYSFMNDDFDKLYQSEQRIEKVFVSFAVLAILVSCLGLFGLVTYAAEQKRREIGIRKVLGASIANITAMLFKDLLKLVTIAIIIASPIAWLAMSTWLQDFAYRIHMSVWFLIISGGAALLISILTISAQAFKAAIERPVKVLKTE